MISGAVKKRIIRAAPGAAPQDTSQKRMSPSTMLHRPKKRNWPSCRSSRRTNMRFHAPGDMNGNRPSSTNTSASAVQSASQSKAAYFLEDAAGAAPPPRKALKNSEFEGSITMKSPFLLKLAL